MTSMERRCALSLFAALCFLSCCFIVCMLPETVKIYLNPRKFTIHTRRSITGPILTQHGKIIGYKHSKSRNDTGYTGYSSKRVDDILSMTPPLFLESYRNPCWMSHGMNTMMKLQCLPYFQIIGCSKSGTTDLFHRIIQHPGIVRSVKEIFYWSWRRYGKYEGKYEPSSSFLTFKGYLSYFNSSKIKETAQIKKGKIYHHLITGHADPMDLWGMYFWKEIPQNNITWLEPKYTTPHLIHHVNPSVKLILILREPSERMYSHYLFRRLGKTPTEFHKHAVGNITLLLNCVNDTGSIRACLYNDTLLNQLKTFPAHGSFYSIHVKEWLSVFPRNQFFIMRTEDYSRNISFYLQKIFKFLNLEDMKEVLMKKISQKEHIRKTAGKSKIGGMLPETKIFLNKVFLPYNKELASVLKDKRYTWDDVG